MEQKLSGSNCQNCLSLKKKKESILLLESSQCHYIAADMWSYLESYSFLHVLVIGIVLLLSKHNSPQIFVLHCIIILMVQLLATPECRYNVFWTEC